MATLLLFCVPVGVISQEDILPHQSQRHPHFLHSGYDLNTG